MLNGKISLHYFIRISIFRRMLLGISISFSFYTIFTLISIIRKSFKENSQLDFPFYSIIFLTLIYILSFRDNKFEPAISTTEMFHKRFFSVEVLDLCNRLNDSNHHCQDCFIAISVLK